MAIIMIKRTISIALALIMVLGIFSITASAADVKILGNLSIKVGETKSLNFTDPSGNKVSVIWESSNPSVATVTASGSVTALKAGTCIMSTVWNSKVYGVNITATGSSSTAKTTTTKTSAYTKLKSYLLNKGKKKSDVCPSCSKLCDESRYSGVIQQGAGASSADLKTTKNTTKAATA